MGKEGRESERARALTNWKADSWAVRMGGNGARKSTHLWMSKSEREGIGESEWHSPMDGQVREGGNQSKQEHSPMDGQVREGGNQSKQPSGTHQRMSKGGRDRSEQGHSPRMGKLGREGIRVSEQHSPIDGQVREGGNRSE